MTGNEAILLHRFRGAAREIAVNGDADGIITPDSLSDRRPGGFLNVEEYGRATSEMVQAAWICCRHPIPRVLAAAFGTFGTSRVRRLSATPSAQEESDIGGIAVHSALG